MGKYFGYAILLALFCVQLNAQNKVTVELEWLDENRQFETVDGAIKVAPTFDGAHHDGSSEFLPRFLKVLDVPSRSNVVSVDVVPLRYRDGQTSDGAYSSLASEEFLRWNVREERGQYKLILDFLPISESDGSLIESFEISYRTSPDYSRRKSNDYATNSVLSSGEWFRIGVTEDGIYRLSKDDLEQLGIEVGSLNPNSLNIFGNGFGQLPYDNEEERPDDLLVNSILIEGEADGVFNDEDYILFYAKGPDSWTFDSELGLFDHHKHEYSDTSYYFIGINTGIAAKRIQSIPSAGSSTIDVSAFDDYAFHEVDRENVLKSGRTWYGEKFDVQTAYTFSGEDYTFQNVIESEPATLRTSLISRTTTNPFVDCRFEIGLNGASVTQAFDDVGTSVASIFADEETVTLVTNTAAPNFIVSFEYIKNTPSAVGWLDWFNLNLRRELIMSGSQMSFRDSRSVGTGEVAAYSVGNAQSIEGIWDVTDPSETGSVQYSVEQGVATFRIAADELREFIAFTGSTFLTPSLFGRVGNQNLHGIGLNGGIDMVIVTPSQFSSQAEQLAEIHRNHPIDPLSVEVVPLNQVYNEFSSGIRDVTAIKWMMKMLYDRANGNEDMMPRYLLLFGDGSYDNKNLGANNTNVIPTYQSLNSLSPVRSYVSDDYFGLLSDDDGESPIDLMDISVGRIVAKNPAEASSVVNKIARYLETGSASSFGSWRNVITLVADDEDNNDHMQNSRTISSQIESYTKVYNLERVFTDAFQQVATPGGDRYPDVNEAIDRRVRNGAFIINYIGHGGELGWAQERILDIPTILDWNNTYQMPIFMTATCEFTRFDDPLRTSAGEFVLLNAGGGGVALLTTTRLVYSGPNFTLNRNFYDALFQRPNNELVTRLGDVYRDCKNNSVSGGLPNHRNFSLVGDPALPMAIPRYDVEMTSITDTLGNPIDTLKALGVARVTGRVVSGSGQTLTSFNGMLEATVYDRVKQRSTLSNDNDPVFVYPTQEDVIYRGLAETVNGEFSFDFVLPKDISFAVDTTARISFYAFSTENDAAGFTEGLRIGSRDENAIDDGEGPDISLFMNDENFVFGGYTDREPILIANIFDDNGINTVGTGIGHDISAVVDGDISNTLILNDYYSSDLNTFKSGSVRFPFDELEPGNHSVELTVWDVHNNSGKSFIEFIVAESEELAIERVLNYPNPFTTYTEFYFEHNQSSEFLNVLIQVYTVSGKLVKSINTVSNTDGFRNEPIPWDGRDDFGDKLATGVYVYKVSVLNPSGESDEKFEKLVILN